MSFQPYPLLPSAAFGGATVAIEGAAQGALFDLLDAAAPGLEGPGGPSQAAVTLVPDPASGGLKVFHGRSKLGQLPASLREAYPQLDTLTGQQLRPQARALISLTPGRGTIRGELALPRPSFVIPATPPPAEPWALLPEGPAREVDTATGDAAELEPGRQYLARVTVIDGIAVLAAGEGSLGSLGPEDSADVRDIVSHYEALDLVAVGRAVTNSEGRLFLFAAATIDLDPSALEPPISPLPDARPAAGDEEQADSPDLAELPDGNWKLTLVGEDVSEGIATTETGRLRAITSPVRYALNPDGTTVLEAGRRTGGEPERPEAETAQFEEGLVPAEEEPKKEPDATGEQRPRRSPGWIAALVFGIVALVAGAGLAIARAVDPEPLAELGVPGWIDIAVLAAGTALTVLAAVILARENPSGGR